MYIELAKRIGRDRYWDWLTKCAHGNRNLTEPGPDFWNFRPFALSPVNQVAFAKALYEEKLPFSKHNMAIVKRLMRTETTNAYTGENRLDARRWAGHRVVGWLR